jgi:CMP-N-acetylneuraminic acid synthetase
LALPTVPLRKSVHINEALDLYENHGRPVFSATTYNFPVSFAFRIDDQGDWSPVFSDSPMVTGNTRSQNQAAACHPNGAIYVRAIADLSKPDLMSFYQDARPYLMEPQVSVDIDSEIDFALATALL